MAFVLVSGGALKIICKAIKHLASGESVCCDALYPKVIQYILKKVNGPRRKLVLKSNLRGWLRSQKQQSLEALFLSALLLVGCNKNFNFKS